MTRSRRIRGSTRPPRFEELEHRTLPSGNPVWTVVGDQQTGTLDDTIVIRRSAEDTRVLEAIVNGTVVSTHTLGDLDRIRIVGGAGDDTIAVNVSNTSSHFLTRVFGGAGHDHLIGTNGRDELRGGDGDDILDGAGGRDVLRAGAGNDSLHGGKGIDLIDGGRGDNTFYGDIAADRVIRLGDNPAFKSANANPLTQVTSLDQVRDWVVRNSVSNWAGWFGRSSGEFSGAAGGSGGPLQATPNGAADGETPVSGTNTQEDGVDEADILKTDGQYLYTVVGDELLIVDVRTPDQPSIVGRVTIDGWVSALYLMGDRAVVLSNGYQYFAPDGEPMPIDSGASLFVDDGGAANMRLWWGYYQSQTIVTTVDLSDRTAPTVASETTLDGWLVDSRAVDGKVYTVVQNDLFLPQPGVIDGTTTYESEADYRARLAANFTDALPGYTTTSADGTTVEGSLVDGADLYIPETVDGTQLLSVTIFDPTVDGSGPTAVTTIAGTSGTVYASTESLYVAATDYVSPWRGEGESTQIYKFALDGDAAPLDAVGTVPGWVLDQFSMDEQDGYFRIATTSGWGQNATNGVYVMADAGDILQTVGAVRDLAPGETIFSVDFEDDTGYVTTFEQVDPLFTLDLSNPTSPRVVGELVIPGYSSYLQTLGDDLVLGVGRDVDPETGQVGGLQLSLFDVSDPANPVRLDVFSFSSEAWGGWSDAEWDHHALSWFAGEGILTLPVTGDWSQPAALEIMHVGRDGIQFVGAISHDSPVLRSLRIGDNLISMSASEIQIHSLTDPSVQVGGLDLPAPPQDEQGPIFIDQPMVAADVAE